MRRLLRALLLGWALAVAIVAPAAEPPAILLAEVYRGQVDVSRYLVSEKLDGVRAIWDGATLRFRSGKEDQCAGLVCRRPAKASARWRTVAGTRHLRAPVRHRPQGSSRR